MALSPCLYAILPHPSEARILALSDASGWTLPRLTPGEAITEDFKLFEFGMNTQVVLGCAVTALHSPYFSEATDEHGFRFVFALENRDPSFQPPAGARWIGRDELDQLDLAVIDLCPVIDTYLRERISSDYPPERAPWALAGWQDAATAWITEQVAAHGWQLTGEIEQVRKWCITCVLKAPTSIGNLYFKAVPPTFACETAITRLLSRHFPTHIPTIVASQDASHWLLLRDFGGTLLGDSKNVADWERALRDFAALQVTMSGQIEALFQCDAMDYRLEVLPEKLDVLLADEEILKPNQITAEEIERVRSLVPRINAMIEEMKGYNLPATIVHSDFHPWNTAVNEDRIIFFDWTDAAVGHPFYDLAPLPLNMIRRRIFPDQPEMIAHLREAYLEGWTSFAPLETLRRALLLGEALGVLQKAINYRHLLRCLEPNERWSVDYTGAAVKDLLTKVEAIQEK
jgi:Phosphotransferase enzyme family